MISFYHLYLSSLLFYISFSLTLSLSPFFMVERSQRIDWNESNLSSLSVFQVNTENLKKYNCNNGSECSTLSGVFNCSLGHCANMSELMLCHHKADGIVIDSEKDNMKLNGFFSCQNSRCTKIKRRFSCDRYCPKIITNDINVFLMQDDNVITAKCSRGLALNKANGNLPGTRLTNPVKIWDEENGSIIASCLMVSKKGNTIRYEYEYF